MVCSLLVCEGFVLRWCGVNLLFDCYLLLVLFVCLICLGCLSCDLVLVVLFIVCGDLRLIVFLVGWVYSAF